ncbi:MAG: 3-hydroxyacyl-CoA dehydrogenase, partial [Rhizobium sp.]|nr:3-hydroxyacyl-CoA dehydrogenase [Rhizobium sp.]
AGRKGQKTGGGWYDYQAGDRRPLGSEEVARLLRPLIQPGPALDAEAIAAHLVGAMAREGEAILGQGIAEKASDIDLVEIHGYGFPRWRGGPMFQAAKSAGSLS